MREPVFTETMRIGTVVRDLEAAMRTYVHDYGIGPWDIYEFNPGSAKDLREYGQPAERSWRLAATMVGQVQWELIQPLDDESVYARFPAEKGAGVHHIAVATPSFDETVGAGRTGAGVGGQRRVQRHQGRVPCHGSRARRDHRDLQRHAQRRPEAGRDVPVTRTNARSEERGHVLRCRTPQWMSQRKS
jgi:hypothetical protein